MQRDGLRARDDPELVPETRAEHLVHAEGLGAIAAPRERVHQQAEAALAERGRADELAPRALGRGELAPPIPSEACT